MATATASDPRPHELNVYRDTIESIWVAIVLAFVLRAFVIEAFVIPTGSMAPRLLGEHWDLCCPACGYEYAYGGLRPQEELADLPHGRPAPPRGARCPNCGKEYPSNERPAYVNGGDRVLVLKYLYQFVEPQPWDVVVFKNPQDNRMNYIKRLIGLPGEAIEIVHGDVFVSTDGGRSFQVRRKPPRAQEAMWQVVYDNDYRPQAGLLAEPGPGWITGRNGQRWDRGGFGGRRLAFQGGEEEAVLDFQPGPGGFLPHYGYNERSGEWKRYDSRVDVCGDLKVSAVLVPGEGPSTLRLSLSSFEFRFEAEVDTSGSAVLSCRSHDLPEGGFQQGAVIGPLAPGRGHQIALEHVDFQASLWIDGRCVLQTRHEQYPGKPAYQWLTERLARVDRQAVPAPDVKLSARGGPCDLWHVRVHRDVYYTAHRFREAIPPGAAGDYARAIQQARQNGDLPRADVRHRPVEPDGPGWGTTGRPIHLLKHPSDRELDEFYVLGDNSPQSLDGRGWTAAAPSLRLYADADRTVFQYQLGTVPRYNLLGRALFVYWPGGHRSPLLPGLPIIPNVGRMRFIR